MAPPWDFGGFLVQSSSSICCSSGLLFFWLPCVSVVSVVPTPPWLLPGPSVVVHVTVPCTLSQFSGSGAANAAGAESATAKRAAIITKLMRLIMLCFLSYLHPPNAYEP